MNQDFVDLLRAFADHEVEALGVGAHALCRPWAHSLHPDPGERGARLPSSRTFLEVVTDPSRQGRSPTGAMAVGDDGRARVLGAAAVDDVAYGERSNHLVPITYCKNSTITEAFAIVLGLPAQVESRYPDPPFIRRVADLRLPDLQDVPGVVITSVQRDLAPPFWQQQVLWDEGRHGARFGHRYLSVHFQRIGDVRYARYDQDLAPQLQTWLQIYRDALPTTASEHLVDKVGFGYVNRFELEPEGFDISGYFRMSFSLNVGNADAGLQKFATDFHLFDEVKQVALRVHVTVEAPSDGKSKIVAVTRVTAEKGGLEAVSFGDQAALEAAVLEAKEAAKQTFFGFASQRTHDIMQVVDDA